MNGVPTGAKDDWAPAPSPADAPAPGPVASGAGKLFTTIFWGLVIAGVSFRVDGFDLLVDAVGFGLVARGALTLSDGSVEMPKRAAVAFRSVYWAGLILAVFALTWVVVDQPSSGSALSGNSTYVSFGGGSPLSTAVVVGLQLVIVVQLLSGIMVIADEQEASALYWKASKLRTYFVAATVVGIVLAIGIGGNIRAGELLIPFLLIGWLYLQLWSTTRQAATQLSLPTFDPPNPRSPGQVPPALGVLFGLAAAVAVWSLLFPAESSSSVESSNSAGSASNLIADQPASEFGYEVDRPQGEEILAQALDRQAAGLVAAPDMIRSASDHEGPCGAPGSSQLIAIDTATGDRVWAQSIASVIEPPVVLGDAVLLTDPYLDQLLPSISAIGVGTGDIRWQHFVEAQQITPWGVATDATTFRLVNLGGPGAGGRLVDLDRSGAVVYETYSEFSEWSDLPESRFVAGGQVVKASIGAGPEYQPHLWLRRSDGSLLQGDAIPFDNTYSTVGNDNSLGDPIQIGQQTVLVLLGSHQGPNSKLVAYNTSDGTIRWQLEHIRSTAVATLDGRDVVVYDKRNTKPADAASTRSLYVVDATDPSEVLWSAELSVNDDGGNGFLGSTGDALVFATPYPAGAGETLGVRFTVIGSERDAPERIVAAEGFGGGVSSHHHLGDELFVAAADTIVTWQDQDGLRSTVVFDDAAQHIALAGATLLAVTGQPPTYCD